MYTQAVLTRGINTVVTHIFSRLDFALSRAVSEAKALKVESAQQKWSAPPTIRLAHQGLYLWTHK
eukprot:SAG31_NODE_6779_length_1892_cov_1.511991_2_plen_65_part_00